MQNFGRGTCQEPERMRETDRLVDSVKQAVRKSRAWHCNPGRRLVSVQNVHDHALYFIAAHRRRICIQSYGKNAVEFHVCFELSSVDQAIEDIELFVCPAKAAFVRILGCIPILWLHVVVVKGGCMPQRLRKIGLLFQKP